ncbi:MAG: hypothetical protein ACRC3B_03030, partial [Bacteroidia bacterium]
MKNVIREYAEFFSRAQLFGHDADALLQGDEIITYHELPSAEEGRRLLSNATPEIRSERQKLFFNPVLMARQRLGQGKHDRGEAMVFA